MRISLTNKSPFIGKKVENIEKRMKPMLENCLKYEPSLLLLDDFDELCGSDSSMEQLTPGNEIISAKLVNAIWNLISSFTDRADRLVVLAAAKSRHSIHPELVKPRGRRFFSRTDETPPLDVSARVDVLGCLIGNCDVDLELEEVAKKCDGFTLGDLSRLVQRARINAAINGKQEANTDDILNSLVDFVPVSHHNANVNKEQLSKTWDDIGGLAEVRKVLIQTLFWPVKYPTLFASCPVRLARGILLYGPSGTGKTLVAAVVAKECGLNFINIKGPELLSKYIGASEQSVRDVFNRARNSKPCLIFFDEFESLAPRRGHDSTGVTDRVVNQLLTELDGVEALEGVYVLAASSRPDLLDPALLRPGRIDNHLICPLPNQNERTEILGCLSRSISLGSDVCLSEIASKTESLSGADLKAIIYNAQLMAVHRLQQNAKITNIFPKKVDLIIHNSDLNAAATEFKAETKPSTKKVIKYPFETEVAGQRVSLA